MAKTDKDKTKDRIQASKTKNPKFHKPYIRLVPGTKTAIDQTLCKGCGEVIAALVQHERLPGHLVYAALVNYELLRIIFDNGSAHETPMCRSCAASLSDVELEDVYAADLAQFAKEEDEGLGKHPWHILADRKPVRRA